MSISKINQLDGTLMSNFQARHSAIKADKSDNREAGDNMLMGVTDMSIHQVLISLTFINFILIRLC